MLIVLIIKHIRRD